MKLTSGLVTLHAVLLLLAGVALLFAPVEVSAVVEQAPPTPSVFPQLLGAAFIGFAAANWIARHSVLGGIYGRAVVAGTQAFSFVGALTLLGDLPAAPGLGFWLLLFVLVYGAVLYSVLFFRSPGLGRSSESPLEV